MEPFKQFEQQDIGKDQPHSQKVKTFMDIGNSAVRSEIMGSEISTNMKRGIYMLEGEQPITPGKRRK
jgi:hypothetical protein